MKTPRTNKPTSNDKYFIRTSNGGFSSCIKGKPTDPECDVLANCVGFANGFFNEILDLGYEKYHLNCNAENFIERAIASGLSVVKEPVIGGIMVWQKGATLNGSDGAGHVAGVIKKISDTQVKTAESGYGSKSFWTATRNKTNGNWGAGASYTYRGCIVPPGYVPEPIPEPIPTPEPIDNDPFPNITDEELAKRVWLGEFGTGEERKQKLGSRYSNVQKLVNQGIGKLEEPKDNKIYYIVQKGDTLWGIANKYYGNGARYHEIAKANNITNPDLIYPGQKLLIP